jgi:hypothetical protein
MVMVRTNNSQLFKESKRPPLSLLRHISSDLRIIFPFEQRADIGIGFKPAQFSYPFDRELLAQLFLWEGEVVLDVETGWSVEDRVVDAFWVVRRGDCQDSLILSLWACEV